MLKGILQNDLFYCNHLGVSENDERDITDSINSAPRVSAGRASLNCQQEILFFIMIFTGDNQKHPVFDIINKPVFFINSPTVPVSVF